MVDRRHARDPAAECVSHEYRRPAIARIADDGGYIVGQIAAIQPGSTDTGAIADAVIAAVGKDVAAEVVTALGQKLGSA